MSTRGAFGFIINGQEKISYNHSDSYPSYLCRNILKELSTLDDIGISHLCMNANNILMVDDQDTPSSEEKEKLEKFFGYCVDGNKEWYSILRDYQGDIEPYCRQDNALSYMIEYKSFLYTSLYCEYAYIINLDTNMVEFYRGGNTHTDAPGRYACPPALKSNNNAVATNDYDYSGGYCGVALVGEAPIEAFMNATEEQINEFVEKIEDFMSDYDFKNVKTFQLEDLS